MTSLKSTLSWELTGFGITGEAGIPLNVGAVGELTGGDSEETDAAEDTGVGKVGTGGDDAVCDGVVDGLSVVLVLSVTRWSRPVDGRRQQ